MKRLVTGAGLKKIAILTVIGALGVAIFKHYVPNSYDPQTVRNYAAAERYMPVLKSLLHADARFTNITMYMSTSFRGSVMLRGEVRNVQELEDLERLVESSKPPMPVRCSEVLPREP
jgi:hypothetical protein